jgi:6-phosphogluconate dehydrogenase
MSVRMARHFVKMVHNGIEYADMQLIAEAYDLLRTGLAADPADCRHFPHLE